ncbi:MAG: HDOD domain-containing protein [Candidatus Zixiibacteriota bacterium]|nr:MAG: HDOD domain-containing protein [candidate division Zixibacteria bacterium]
MSEEILQKILRDNKELSSLPQVIVDVIRIANNPDASMAELVGVIKKDPALTAKLLRIVNSPYYCPASKISTVQQAVVTIGLRTVTAVALAMSIYDKFKTMAGSIDRKKFWRHSLEVALTSRMIAGETGYKEPEEAFVAGLLHDIGSLVLEASFPEEFARICKLTESGVRMTSVEERSWGTNHARVGQFLLSQWRLPQNLADAVGNHHFVFKNGNPTPQTKLNQIVNLANHISKFRVLDMPQPDTEEFESKQILTSNLGLSFEALSAIEERSVSEVAEEASYLEIEIGSMEEILRDANRLLFKQYIIAEELLMGNIQMHRQFIGDRPATQSGGVTKEMFPVLIRFTNDTTTTLLNTAENIKTILAETDPGDQTGFVEASIKSISRGVDSISAILVELRKFGDRQKSGGKVTLTSGKKAEPAGNDPEKQKAPALM